MLLVVACISRMHKSITRCVSRSVGWSHFDLSIFPLLHYRTCPYAQLDFFHHCPCPPARDFGSRVSGLVQRPIGCFNANVQLRNLRQWIESKDRLYFITQYETILSLNQQVSSSSTQSVQHDGRKKNQQRRIHRKLNGTQYEGSGRKTDLNGVICIRLIFSKDLELCILRMRH